MSTHDVTVHGLEDTPLERARDTIVFILNHVRTIVLQPIRPTDRVGLGIESSSLKLGLPVWTPLIELSQLTTERWMMEFEKVLNSQEGLAFDESFKVRVDVASPPGGSCRRDVPQHSELFLKKKDCVITINNHDEICMARALVVAKAIADYGSSSHPEVKKMRRGKKKQTAEAKILLRKAGFYPRRFTIADLPAFEAVLGEEYQVYVLSREQACSIIYPKQAAGQEKKTTLLLLLHNEHFDVCTSIAPFFGRSYFCMKCRKGYDNRTEHRCEAMCVMCLRADCLKDEENKITCDVCHRVFLGADCFDHHRTKPARGPSSRASICSQVYRCQDCLCTVSNLNRDASNPHMCGETSCKHCRLHVIPEEHHCFMKPVIITAKDLQKYDKTRFAYFDLETYVNEHGVLVANYAVSVLSELLVLSISDISSSKTFFLGCRERSW